MNPVPDADDASSPLLSGEDRKEVREQYEDAEKKLHWAAKNLDDATSDEERADLLRQIHRHSLRMLICGSQLGKPTEDVENLLNELLHDDPPTFTPNQSAVNTLSPSEIAAVYRCLGSSNLPKDLAITGESPIGDIACNMVRTALSSTAVLVNGLKDDNEAELAEEVVGHYSFEQLLFWLHMLDQLAFLDSTLSKRRAFMDQLVESVFETLALSLADDVDLPRFAEYFASIYNERQDEYSKYRQPPRSRRESSRGTLLWEYGKRMAALVSTRKDPLRVVIIGNLAVRYIHDLMPYVRKAASDKSLPNE
jgi:hypothetical protein